MVCYLERVTAKQKLVTMVNNYGKGIKYSLLLANLIIFVSIALSLLCLLDREAKPTNQASLLKWSKNS